MDDLAESIGQLSTSAKEWKPSSQRNATPAPQSPTPSSPYRSPVNQHHLSPAAGGSPSSQWQVQQRPTNDWNPAAVGTKEFVPGAGWAGGASTRQQPHDATPWRTEQQQQPTAEGPHANEASWGASTVPAGPAPPPPRRSLHSLGMSDELWRYHREVTLESQREMDPADPRHKAVPPPFSNAFQLDETNAQNSRSSFGYPTSVFKVVNREDGNLYCLRRVDNVRSVSHKIASAVTDRWMSSVAGNTAVVEHPGVVRFYRVFVANRAVFFVHQYIPGARTLRERVFHSSAGPFPEPLVWSCSTQLVAAIRAVHTGNLACRTIQANHILCQTSNSLGQQVRLRINCLGMVDALEFETRKQLSDLQREDMIDLGRLMLSLATGTEITRNSDNNTLRQCDAFLRQNYSRELVSLILSLLSPSSNTPNIFDVSRAIAGHTFDELDRAHASVDKTEAALGAEFESGRALRLLLKLGFVNERPEFGVNRRWTESGDCYVLKLFRDYVFHQADGAGNPVMDLGHVVTALNKLDASDEEKIVLSSRDGKTLMVVSFADVARCLDSAYNELCAGSVPPGVLQY